MPAATARAVARQHKVKYVKARLTNAAYNCQLGEAHLSGLIDSYGGSYFMALAAYNAGGGRVKEWVDAFGDPRDPGVDPIDWVESIPFTETRHYVIKIMETLQLYRSRLEGISTSDKMSWQMAAMPEEKSSARASTSLVTRVTSIPTGLRFR